MDEPGSFLNEISMQKPESFREERFVPVKKSGKSIIVLAMIIVMAVFLVIFIYLMDGTTMPDMKSWKSEDIQSWVKKNHTNTKLTGVYNLEYPANTFVSQDVPAGRKIKKRTSLNISYSLGGDPNEQIELIDFKSMKVKEIKDWINRYKLTGINIKYENNDVIPKDTVISYDIIDGTHETFLRKSRIVIYVSSGTEDMDETTEMPDFLGKTKTDVMKWSDEHHIKVTFNETFSDSFDYGIIFRQSIKKTTKITRKDNLVLDLSLGSPIKVPDFNGLSKPEASELATILGITIFYRYQVTSQEADQVIGQDIQAGIQIDRKKLITLTITKKTDFVNVPDFVGLTPQEADKLAGLYNIKVFVKNPGGSDNNTTVVSQTKKAGTSIHKDEIIFLVTDSKSGSLMPDFKGLSKNEATVVAQNRSITVTFNDVKITSSPNGTVIRQNIKAGSPIGTNKNILLDIAINSDVQAKDLTSMSRTDAEAWAAQNGVTLRIIEQYSDTYAVGTLYNQSIINQIIPSGGSIIIYYSLGQVGLDNFVGKTKLDILNWQKEVNSKGARIKLSFGADGNSKYPRGVITSQSTSSDFVKIDETITVWISTIQNSGKYISDMENMEESEFKLWCNMNSVPYTIMDSYSDVYKSGRMFGQNYTNTYLPDGGYLKMYRSLGKVSVPDFTNQEKAKVEEWQEQVNGLRANIRLVFTEEWSDTVSSGTVMRQSVKNSMISLNETVSITISKGLQPAR